MDTSIAEIFGAEGSLRLPLAYAKNIGQLVVGVKHGGSAERGFTRRSGRSGLHLSVIIISNYCRDIERRRPN